MVKTLGVVFIAIILSTPVILGAFLTDSQYLFQFATEQSIALMATVLALNVAIVTFLIGHLLTIEAQAKKELFPKTRRQLKHNVYLMVGIFFLNFVVVACNQEGYLWTVGNKSFDGTLILSSATAVLTILLIIALVEIIDVVFNVTNFIKNEKK